MGEFGIVNDENRLKKEIYDRIKPYVTSNIAKRVTNLLDVMRMECCAADLLLYQDRIHVANGTYHLDGTFSTEKDYCRNRLPVAYHPEAPQPVTWLHFLSQLLEPEDILTLQEFIGYCFIPSTKGLHRELYRNNLYFFCSYNQFAVLPFLTFGFAFVIVMVLFKEQHKHCFSMTHLY